MNVLRMFKAIYIMLMMILTLALWTLFHWIKPLKRILDNNIVYYGLKMAKWNRDVGNDEVADQIESMFNGETDI